MFYKNLDGDDVGLTQVVDEATDVTILPGVYTISLSILTKKRSTKTH